ncbi:uncharacterized protein LODBEIA_P23660 [Lodderomyces beijingensis]|uniref:Biogenesis of lysosome-related organelles complex 1 subunit KXD1 n=1 Tax=Lodderomyces beijingensis TaxID=1775926 RepID=A0ABP0ZJ28_9ASCO
MSDNTDHDDDNNDNVEFTRGDDTGDMAHRLAQAGSEPSVDDVQDDQIDEDERRRPTHPSTFMANNNDSFVSSGTEDEYILSDEEDSADDRKNLLADLSNSELPHLSNLNEHARYFANSLQQALDSSELDKSLVLQAQISGNLNNENQKLIEQRELLSAKLMNLQQLFESNFGTRANNKASRVERLRGEISSIEHRIEKLKNGGSKSSFPISFLKAKPKVGVAQRFPIEYNQARDKVLERLVDDDDAGGGDINSN